MILIIDNYDSFVYNLARYVAQLGFPYEVIRNSKITLEEIESLKPQGIIISPGPCTPQEAGISIALIQKFAKSTPILGVCLGHQAIGEAFGGRTIRAENPVHGKEDNIYHDNSALFKGLPNPFPAGRYHSLITDITDCDALKVTAWNESDQIMAMQHKTHPTFGIQFHPESILTPHGITVIETFLGFTKSYS